MWLCRPLSGGTAFSVRARVRWPEPSASRREVLEPRMQRQGERSLQLELADRSCVDGLLDGSVNPLADQNLTGRGMSTQPRGKVCHRAKGAVVIAALEADPAKRCITRFDSDPEAEFRAPPSPSLRQLGEPFLGGEREPDRLNLVIFDVDWVVEEHHHSVTRKVFECAVVERISSPSTAW